MATNYELTQPRSTTNLSPWTNVSHFCRDSQSNYLSRTSHDENHSFLILHDWFRHRRPKLQTFDLIHEHLPVLYDTSLLSVQNREYHSVLIYARAYWYSKICLDSHCLQVLYQQAAQFSFSLQPAGQHTLNVRGGRLQKVWLACTYIY